MDPLTEKERLSFHDDDEASVVPWVFGADEHFQRSVKELAKFAEGSRRKEARAIARRYVPYEGPHFDLIVDLLVYASCESLDPSGPVLQTLLVNRKRRAVWSEADIDELDPQRVRERWTTLEQGAQRLARRGSGKCIELECSTPLRADKLRQRPRALYCDVHERDTHESLKSSQVDQIRQALDAATGQRRRARAARRT